MGTVDTEYRFFLSFDSAIEFDKAFERKGEDTGIFFRSTRPLKVGEPVAIIISVKGINTPATLEGRVVWRRAKAGGEEMPAGVFVGLVARDRARLDALVRYMTASQNRQDRRKHFRHPALLPATYRTNKGEFRSETRNISRGGAFLRCLGPLLTVGARFSLTLYLEGEKGKATALDVQVAWIDYFEETKGMGVEFAGKRGQRKKIERFVDTLEKSLKER
jgi:Tfp pilus assembly protein PilZ